MGEDPLVHEPRLRLHEVHLVVIHRPVSPTDEATLPLCRWHGVSKSVGAVVARLPSRRDSASPSRRHVDRWRSGQDVTRRQFGRVRRVRRGVRPVSQVHSSGCSCLSFQRRIGRSWSRSVIWRSGSGSASWSWRVASRLWGQHSRRPLNCEVMPPWAWGVMWSTSQRGTGSSQPEGCSQCRVRTSTARRNRPVKRALWGDADGGERVGEQHGLQQRSVHVRDQMAGVDDGAVGQLAEVGEAVVTQHDGEQRGWAPRALRGGGGAGGHLDQRRGASLRRRTGHTGGLISQVQLTHEAVELGEEGGAAERVEVPVEADDAVQHRGGVDGRLCRRAPARRRRVRRWRRRAASSSRALARLG